MKNLIITLLILISMGGYSQSWNGIPISGSVSQLKANMSAKGFVFEKKENNCYIFNGRVNIDKYEAYVFVTPITGIVTKMVLYREQKLSWSSLLEDYEYTKSILTDKYGLPKSFEYFKNPYYLGDGYEYSAVTTEMCNYASFWLEADKNTNISMEISKYHQIKILYENINNLDKYNDETKKQNNAIF